MNLPVIALALSHGAVICIALALGWRVADVVWIYWCEGIVLGVFSCVRLVRLPNLPAILLLGLPFAFFHLVYAVFFIATGHPPRVGAGFALSLAGLLASHVLALREAFRRDDVHPPDVEHFCGIAGVRMLPVMVTVGVAMYFAARTEESSKLQLVTFLLVAGFADVVMQIREQGVRRSGTGATVTVRSLS